MQTSQTTLIPASQPLNLDTMPRADLAVIFDGFKNQLDSLVSTASTLTVTDASQTANIKLARTTRLSLKNIRLDIEKKRKELTEYHLKTKQHIDQCAKWLKDQIEPLEKRLEDQENFVVKQEEKRKAALRYDRAMLLTPLGVDTTLYALQDMDEGEFQTLLSACQHRYEQELLAIAEAREAQERIRLENERLKKEADLARKEREALEAKAATERREAEAKLQYERQQAEAARQQQAAEEKKKQDAIEAKHKAEQQKREAAERELQEAKDKEAAAVATQKAAEEKAAQAPDAEKLVAFALAFQEIPFPVAVTEAGKAIFEAVSTERFRFAQWIASNATKL